MRLILASASPRRAALLKAAGFEFETITASVDEGVRANEPPEGYVERLASEKSAKALSGISRTGIVVLGADTIVVVDGRILGKPDGEADARRMLRRLSGCSHEVMTGLSIRAGDREVRRVETTIVTFAPMSAEEVDWYVSTGEGRDKAGAYAVQGLASRFVQRIEGSYSNVVGLPIAAVYEVLQKLGVWPNPSCI